MKKKNGFNLAELFIVIAIIGILAAILAPQIREMRNTSKIETTPAGQVEEAPINSETEIK